VLVIVFLKDATVIWVTIGYMWKLLYVINYSKKYTHYTLTYKQNLKFI